MPPVHSPRMVAPERMAADMAAALIFCTRLPMARLLPPPAADLARASWAFPVAGALVGLLAGFVYWLTQRLGLPALPAAGLSVAAMIAMTGALHEDGLADSADGLGGSTPERRLSIMRDSRSGSYGVCALILSIALRASAVASISDPALAIAILVAAHAAGRALMPAFMALVPPARLDGLSAGLGRPPLASVAAAAAIGLLALFLGLGAIAGVIALLYLVATFAGIAHLSRKLIGGQTGDVVGALEQCGEAAVLLVAAAWL